MLFLVVTIAGAHGLWLLPSILSLVGGCKPSSEQGNLETRCRWQMAIFSRKFCHDNWGKMGGMLEQLSNFVHFDTWFYNIWDDIMVFIKLTLSILNLIPWGFDQQTINVGIMGIFMNMGMDQHLYIRLYKFHEFLGTNIQNYHLFLVWS